MAENAEFEEKEYEQPLNFELVAGANTSFWSPGQVLETRLGIDAAVFTANQKFWSTIGRVIKPGFIMDRANWLQAGRSLPTFKTNLLLQAKRPVFRSGVNTKYSKLGIKGSYWKFAIVPHQQKALELFHTKVGRRALVCYASPAFHKATDLFFHMRNSALIDNSTFVQVNKLTGHKEWVYNQAGTTGLASSKIEQVRDLAFTTLVSNLLESTGPDDPLDNLRELHGSVLSTIETLPKENPIKREFYLMRESFQIDRSSTESIVSQEAIELSGRISIFCTLCNVDWLVGS
jgi:hypothetical protein